MPFPEEREAASQANAYIHAGSCVAVWRSLRASDELCEIPCILLGSNCKQIVHRKKAMTRRTNVDCLAIDGTKPMYDTDFQSLRSTCMPESHKQLQHE